MARHTELGEYLTARRALVQPDDVGLVVRDGHRRVSGLRREEVAVLAGISAEYYLRLEQGRDRNPTSPVLDALARVFQLDTAATSYLFALARGPGTVEPPITNADDLVHLQWLIDSWPTTAAMVQDRHMDILAVNATMSVLLPAYRPGENSLTLLLTDASVRAMHRDWDGLSARSIALLRSMIGLQTGNPRTGELIGELSERSERFRQLWGRNDVINRPSGIHHVDHPIVGALALHFEQFTLAGTDDWSIFTYYVEPHSPDAAAFALLSSGSPH